ncbi:arsenate reductase/protein-tyrosine-phosphatase family protein [Nonomuraea helvata]|uniref:Phosphotyrosine protein phosphatase I domain-containing protein n=1 Tax=Nonomuraea helvata TaxID=37484 RepID=A0ABV5S8B0_9ACTN
MTSGQVLFHILFVCTGNLCRSPLAERLTRSALGPPFVVTSAGTHAEPGVEMAERSRQVLVGLGGDPDGFVSQPLTAELLAGADLVLTAAREHRAEAVTRHLQAAPRVFTIVEFGALAAAAEREQITCHRDAVRRANALVEQAQALRGLVTVDRPDIPDPMGRWVWAHKAAGRRIAKALSVPLELLKQPWSS